jgi:hypothetical protein
MVRQVDSQRELRKALNGFAICSICPDIPEPFCFLIGVWIQPRRTIGPAPHAVHDRIAPVVIDGSQVTTSAEGTWQQHHVPHSQGLEKKPRRSRVLITRSLVVLTLPHDGQIRSRVRNPGDFTVRETVGRTDPHFPHFRPESGNLNSATSSPSRQAESSGFLLRSNVTIQSTP